ncbi:MAG TPA: hypothetical protein VG326_08345 [Tepidisphaeraceae bacterium]|nr:hypothetical protein [Tepidisphaeraceae bacterium]
MSISAKIADARQLAESCRVTFDLERLRANIESGLEGEQVTRADVNDWLEALGFSPSGDGVAWIGRRRTLRHFGTGEVLTIEPLQ